MDVKTLRDKQRRTYSIYLILESLIRMINLNSENIQLTEATPIWKVLIYDKAGQEIISPVLKVNDLRDNGVTVHA
jgi:hypothetical protein